MRPLPDPPPAGVSAPCFVVSHSRRGREMEVSDFCEVPGALCTMPTFRLVRAFM